MDHCCDSAGLLCSYGQILANHIMVARILAMNIMKDKIITQELSMQITYVPASCSLCKLKTYWMTTGILGRKNITNHAKLKVVMLITQLKSILFCIGLYSPEKIPFTDITYLHIDFQISSIACSAFNQLQLVCPLLLLLQMWYLIPFISILIILLLWYDNMSYMGQFLKTKNFN